MKGINWFKSVIKARLPEGRSLGQEGYIRYDHPLVPGEMMVFRYDPKLKETLPIYDMFPLCIPYGKNPKGDGFYGINVHYLNPHLRRLFLERLRRMQSHGDKVSVEELRRFANGPGKAGLHMYLADHVDSAIWRVPHQDYKFVADLPMAIWRGNKS